LVLSPLVLLLLQAALEPGGAGASAAAGILSSLRDEGLLARGALVATRVALYEQVGLRAVAHAHAWSVPGWAGLFLARERLKEAWSAAGTLCGRTRASTHLPHGRS
jgi:hypothetical protein